MAASINKWLGKSTGLQAILEKQKAIQECMVKVNPCTTNVSSALLKWSITESNLSLFDAFSSWADLDHALVQLSQSVIDQHFAFRQTFKNIQMEQRRLTELQKDTDSASKKVNALMMKLDNARKAKKVDTAKVENLESELMLAKGKEKEMISILETKGKDFEYYKGKCVKEILQTLSESYVQYLEKSLEIWNVKFQIANAMAVEPVYHGENLSTDSHLKVSNLYSKLSLELPAREETLDMKNRSLPAQPPADSLNLSSLPRVSSAPVSRPNSKPFPQSRESKADSYQWQVSKDSSDDEDYAFPDEVSDDRHSDTNDHGDVYLIPEQTEKNNSQHPSPPLTPHQTSGDEAGGTDSSDSSAQSKDKTSSLNRGIKVLPSGGTMRGPNPRVKEPPQELGMRKGRKTPPPSPVPPLQRVDENKPQIHPNNNTETPNKRPPPPNKLPEKPVSKKPVIRPKPPTLTKKLTNESIIGSKESLREIDEDEHEYSDVPIELDTPRYPPTASDKSPRILRQNNNIKQVVESDTDSDEDYENINVNDIY